MRCQITRYTDIQYTLYTDAFKQIKNIPLPLWQKCKKKVDWHRESNLTLGRAWKFPWAMEFSMGDGNFHGRCFFCGHGNFQGLEISMAMYYWIDAIALNLVFDGMFLSFTWNHLLVWKKDFPFQ